MGSDIREASPDNATLDGQSLKSYGAAASSARVAVAGESAPVGTVRQWLALDDVAGSYYPKDFTLRAVGEHIEVWVANDTSFPEGDCRAQVPDSTTVNDQQVADLVEQFDTNIYPKETAAFSTPPDRDGSANGVPGLDTTVQGDDTVALIDNVRDDNYYSFPEFPTYIAGFFSSALTDALDRNIMTIDAFDWIHRTGSDVVDEPTDDPCTSRPARPNLYDGVFAHEWQHLLHSYTDPAEETWVNEGLSDYAISLTGYADTTKTVFEPRAESHLYCFQGFGTVQTPYNPNARDCGGPENSLNLWGGADSDNPNAVLADYGNAWSFMLYLRGPFGDDILSRLHNDGDLQGLASVEAQLKWNRASHPCTR